MTGLARSLSGRGGLLAVLLAVLILALPGFFSLPPVDRDEVLFAQASRQMLASGDPVDIRFADQPRYKKPAGIYWLQAAAAAATGRPDQIWSYRLVSVAGMMLAASFAWAIARRVTSGPGAVLAGVMLASCLVAGAEMRLAKTDAMLLGLIMAGQWALARIWLPRTGADPMAPDRLAPWVFWSALAGTILVKGPIGPMVLGFTLAGLGLARRDLSVLRALRPGRGLVLLAVLVAPWFLAITIKSGGAFWAASVGHDMAAKLAQGQESHGAPPGSYLAALWLTFWPGSMLLLAALPGIWAARRQPFMVMALAWVVPTWIVFEVTSTKLVHYVLPTYPALAILTAMALVTGQVWRWAAWILAWVPGAILLALVVLAPRVGLALPVIFWPLAVVATALGALVPLALRRGGPAWLSGALGLSALGLSAAVYPSLARIEGLWPAQSLARIAAQHPGCTLTVAGYDEPSLVFWTANQARIVAVDEARAALAASGCQLVALPEGTLTDPPLAQVSGLDLGSGKPVRLSVYLKAE